MLVAIPPAQPAVPLAQVAIVEKVPRRPVSRRSRSAVRPRTFRSKTTRSVTAKPLSARLVMARLKTARSVKTRLVIARSKSVGHLADDRGSYRPAEASWYGGGGSLACGGTLTSSTLGVANKTLPCGTWIVLRYHGHKVEVPVIDRGPYVAGREFDLTEATKRALGFGDLGEVWWRVR